MSYQGVFGYIIGKKTRMMYVKNDANLLWQILVREIYVLMKHYKTEQALQEAFDTVKVTKLIPKEKDKEKCKMFTDFEVLEEIPNWYSILNYCQSSYINILEAGYIVKQTNEIGHVFMLDFNKSIARFYTRELNGKIKELNIASIKDIMEFDDMPRKSYAEIVTEMNEQFADFYDKYSKVQVEIDKINIIISQAKQQCSYNIEEKAKKLLDDMIWERKKLIKERRVFYNRLKNLDLIEDSK